jgi:hypothetical protein
LQGVRGFTETQARRLLRVLLLRVGQMPADPATEILLRIKEDGDPAFFLDQTWYMMAI